MNSLRPLFIGLYPVFLAAVSVLAAARLIGGTAGPLAWWGVLLTTLPFLLFLLRVSILKDMPRTSRRLPIIQSLAVAGFFLALYSVLVMGARDYPALGLAAAGLALFILYNFWYSELDPKERPALAPGQNLPEFSLEDTTGEVVTSDDLRAAPSLLVFYRGNWCPFCTAQIRELADRFGELGEIGVRTLFISPQPQHKAAKMAARFEIGARFLTDRGNRLARRLGIEAEKGLPLGLSALGYDAESVRPTIILLDARGRIIRAECSENYRIRPLPGDLIATLRGLAEAPRSSPVQAGGGNVV